MALGIESNNLAPALIQSSGAALVQGIRQIGQQVSGHLTEMQTKRDLAALGQEAQALNVESNEFPTQLAQLVTRHPLAARDERGLMALSAMGKAHGQWQATEAEARAFNRAMAMQTARDTSARDLYDYKRTQELGDPQNVPGVGLVVPKDPVTGQPNVLIPAAPRTGTSTPFRSTPQGIMDARTGEITKPAPPKVPPASAQLSKERFNAGLLKSSASSLKSEIDAGLKRIDDAEKEQAKILQDIQTMTKDEMKQVASARFAELDKKKHAVIAEVNEKKLRHLKLQESLGAIQSRLEEGEADAAGAGLLPPLPATTELPILSPAEAAKQPPGTQFRDKNGNVRTVPAPTAG